MDRFIKLLPPSIDEYELENAINSISIIDTDVKMFEKNISNMLSIDRGIAISSGSASFHLALMVLGVGCGDRVYFSDLAIPDNCYPSLYLKAVPEFIDCKIGGWGMCELALEKALNKAKMLNDLPKAIVISDLYGQSADYDKLLPICEYYQIPVIEDASQAIGSKYNGSYCGTFGKINILSFDIENLITTMGGGMILTNDKKFDHEICNNIEVSKYYDNYYKMSNINATIGLSQFECLYIRILKKKRIYDIYKESLSDLPITMLPTADKCKPNYWLSAFVIHENCDIIPEKIIHALKEANIEACSIYTPMHLNQKFKDCSFYTSYSHRNNSQQLYERGICLPSGLDLTIKDQQSIIRIIRNAFGKKDGFSLTK